MSRSRSQASSLRQYAFISRSSSTCRSATVGPAGGVVETFGASAAENRFFHQPGVAIVGAARYRPGDWATPTATPSPSPRTASRPAPGLRMSPPPSHRLQTASVRTVPPTSATRMISWNGGPYARPGRPCPDEFSPGRLNYTGRIFDIFDTTGLECLVDGMPAEHAV